VSSKVTVIGKHGVSATILADSISPQGIRLTTMEIEYPRIILAELNTHGMLCKNSASSRAIPFAKMAEQLKGRPIRFGQANKGMQDKGEDFDATVLNSYTPEEAWEAVKKDAIFWSKAFFNAGYHKQIGNRLTEPFQMMKTVISATEWNNFFWLRDHEAADPSIAELASCMRVAREESEPQLLFPGEYHLPYIQFFRDDSGGAMYAITDDNGNLEWLTADRARKVSAARCAAVSFRNTDYTLEKSLEVYERLVGDERKHASAFQHQATPMKASDWDIDTDNPINHAMFPWSWEDGISHVDREGQLWSAQFRGWIMFRKLIAGENISG
jgi:hypothetical protein